MTTFGKVLKQQYGLLVCFALAVAVLIYPMSARAGGVDLHIGVVLPFAGVAAAPPVVVTPPPAVVVQPRPYVVYRRPVVVEAPPPVYYYPHYRHVPPGHAKRCYDHRWRHHTEYGARWHRRAEYGVRWRHHHDDD